MHDLLHTGYLAYGWVTTHWGIVLALVGGAGGLSTGLEYVLHKLKIDSKKLAFSLLHVLGLITTTATVVLASLPNKDLAPIYASLVLLAETWHRFVISPFYNSKLLPYLQYEASLKQAAVTPAEPAAPVAFE